jgi:hypothetical protein|mmetsp:Transcript_32717/g.54847  ORF Transcript_32717/g.54847 Transcript_32717/m.54847 type:complete len:288 (+) Transcript_32717:1181-2044(+)
MTSNNKQSERTCPRKKTPASGYPKATRYRVRRIVWSLQRADCGLRQGSGTKTLHCVRTACKLQGFAGGIPPPLPLPDHGVGVARACLTHRHQQPMCSCCVVHACWRLLCRWVGRCRPSTDCTLQGQDQRLAWRRLCRATGFTMSVSDRRGLRLPGPMRGIWMGSPLPQWPGARPVARRRDPNPIHPLRMRSAEALQRGCRPMYKKSMGGRRRRWGSEHHPTGLCPAVTRQSAPRDRGRATQHQIVSTAVHVPRPSVRWVWHPPREGRGAPSSRQWSASACRWYGSEG